MFPDIPLAGIPTQTFESRELCWNFLFCLKKDNGLDNLQTELSMDVNAQYKSGMLELDVTQSLLGRYIGIEPSRASRGLTEEIPFDTTETRDIIETITAMRSVQGEMPLPINWTQIGKCKPRVEARRKELHEQADPIVKSCTLIRISRTSFFLTVRGGQVISTPSEMQAAAFESPSLASEVVQELGKLGTTSRIEFFGAFRHKSTMSHTLVDVGFEPAAIESADNGTD